MGTTGAQREAIVKVGDIVEGRYRIIKTLGEGGMGTVFLAEHALIKRRVAIKILHQDLATDGDVIERFMNEARAAGTLGHPNIVESTDMGFTANHVPYIVFEYLEGTLLTDEIYRVRGMPVRRVVKIAAQIASALSAAHRASIVHRDLKSDNVFLTDKDDLLDHVKILDFGISRFLESEMSHGLSGSQNGTIMGTPQFMAPEQITDPGAVDGRADIYALGVIMYEMLEARRPFSNGDDPQELLHRILDEQPPAMTRPEIPHGLVDVIMNRMMAKDASYRFQTMGDVEAALEQYVTRDGTPLPRRRTAPTPVVEQDIARHSTLIPRPMQAHTPYPGQSIVMPVAPQTSRPYALYGIAAGGLLLGAIGLVIGLRGSGSDTIASKEPAPIVAPAAATQPAPQPLQKEAPKKINVKFDSDIANARVVFRRRMQAAPTAIEIAPSDVVELVEVSAPGYKTVRYWLTFDRETHLMAHLEKGTGSIEASEEQTLVALGELQDANAKPAVVAKAEPPKAADPKPADPKPAAAVAKIETPKTIEMTKAAEPKTVETKPVDKPVEVVAARMAPRKIGRSADTDVPSTIAPETVAVPKSVPAPPPAPKIAETEKPAAQETEVPPVAEPPKAEPPKADPVEQAPKKVVDTKKAPAKPAGPAFISAAKVTKVSGPAPNIMVSKYEGADLPATIAVKVCIDTSGHVTQAAVITKLDSSLVSEISSTLSKWVYKPYVDSTGAATAACFPVGLRTR